MLEERREAENYRLAAGISDLGLSLQERHSPPAGGLPKSESGKRTAWRDSDQFVH